MWMKNIRLNFGSKPKNSHGFKHTVNAVYVCLWCEENISESEVKDFSKIPFKGEGWQIVFEGTVLGSNHYRVIFDDPNHLTLFLLNPPVFVNG